MKLRNYQSKAVEAIFEAWKKFKSVLVVLPTGCGKTVVFASVIKRLLDSPAAINSVDAGLGKEQSSEQPINRPTDHVASNNRCIVLAHREELITQARDKIIAIVPGADVQVEMADFKVADYFGKKADVVVSTVQTQTAGGGQVEVEGRGRGRQRMCKFDPAEFAAVVIDEAHHATARSYRECIDHYCQNDNCRVLGVTATPDRADETALGNVFDAVAFEYTVTEAIEDGWLVPIRQKLVKVESLDFSGVSTSAGDLNSAELAEVMEDERNLHGIVAPVLQICEGKRTILFASSVKHAERLAEIINRSGKMKSEFVSGLTPKEDRRRRLEAFKRGDIDILCNVGVLTEGFDDAGVEVVVMARPTQSRALYAQMAGRATRPAAEIAAKLGMVEDSLDSSAASHCVDVGLSSELSSDQQTNRPTDHVSPTESLPDCAVASPISEAQDENNRPCPAGLLIGCSDGSSLKRQSDSKEDCALDASESVSSRAAALRRKMIAESSKPSCLIVDFVGNSGRHKLVTTLDILGGKEIDEEAIRTRARKIIEASPDGTNTAEAIAEARKEIAERKAREAKRREFIQASAKFVEIEVDPFNIYDLPPVERLPNDRTRRLSLKQEMLLRTRLHVDPQQLGYARSNQLLQEFFRRANSGLASLPQSKLLKRFGIDVPLRSDEAKRIIDRCLASSKR